MELLGSLWELQGALSELLGQLLEFLGSLLGAILAQRARLEAIFARVCSVGNNFHSNVLDWEQFSLERANFNEKWHPEYRHQTGSEFEAGASNWKRV